MKNIYLTNEEVRILAAVLDDMIFAGVELSDSNIISNLDNENLKNMVKYYGAEAVIKELNSLISSLNDVEEVVIESKKDSTLTDIIEGGWNNGVIMSNLAKGLR